MKMGNGIGEKKLDWEKGFIRLRSRYFEGLSRVWLLWQKIGPNLVSLKIKSYLTDN